MSHRSQSRQKLSVASRWTPWEMSTVSLTQAKHSAPVAVVPSMGAPQL